LPTQAGRTLLEGDGRLWAAAPFLPGQPELEPDTENWRERGRLLARLHQDMAAFALGAQRPGFAPTAHLDSWFGESRAASFEDAASALARHEPGLAAMLRERRSQNARELASLGYDSLSLQPIHGDFQRFNLLWTGSELTGLLDFDSARLDVRIADLASTLVPFLPIDATSAAASLAGYESVSPLSPTERALLAPLARGKLVWWVCVLLDGWLAHGGEVPDGIARTLTLRFSALDAAIPAWEAAWRP
jgi:Ser/Thr protein kinase RdoA (MazF antagonist)